MSDAPHPVRQLLPLERVDESTFGAVLEGYLGQAFGGSTLGCATLAAIRSCAAKPLVAVHAHFLRPAPAGVPVQFEVDAVRDGRRLAHRRVSLREEGKLGFELMARFDAGRAGPELAQAPLPAELPRPETLKEEAEVAELLAWEWWEPHVIEHRWVGEPWLRDAGDSGRVVEWVRPRHGLPDDAALQYALLAYLSDVDSHWPVARSLNGRFEPIGFTSLDESIWFHRHAVWDDWWLLTSRCAAGHGGRALTTRELRDAEGRVVATMAQEALIADPE